MLKSCKSCAIRDEDGESAVALGATLPCSCSGISPYGLLNLSRRRLTFVWGGCCGLHQQAGAQNNSRAVPLFL
jgi:hypothetical protein